MNKVTNFLLTTDLIDINAVGAINIFKFNLSSIVGVLAASNTALAKTLNIDDINSLSSLKTLEIWVPYISLLPTYSIVCSNL